MKTLKTALLILLLSTAIKAQIIPRKIVLRDTDAVVYDQNKTFKNQGEQENYWAEELFKQKYKKGSFNKYNGDIKLIDENHFQFGNQYLELYNYRPELKPILNKGILYPQVFGLGDIRITDFEELKFLSHSDKVKRFRLWIFFKGFPNSGTAAYNANPIVYFIELTNNKATSKTTTEDFIKDAELTFVRSGWMIL